MSLRSVGLAIAVIALVIALATAYVVYNLTRRELYCSYRTYINTTCHAGVCEFTIPVESGKWYRIIEVTCRGVGMLSLYFTASEKTYLWIQGTNDISVILSPNETASLPVRGKETYTIYVMTNKTLGYTSGKVKIVEVS